MTGLSLSPNKTLQGSYALQVGGEAKQASRRAMPDAVFEVGGDAEALLSSHWEGVAPAHRGHGRDGLSLAWTSAHPDRGPTQHTLVKMGALSASRCSSEPGIR
jgi:hypothetical protein